MADEWVIDASVAAKCFIEEPGTEAARAFAASGVRLIAPELILVELASVAIKRLRRGDIPSDLAADMGEAAPQLIDDLYPLAPLVPRAQDLALEHGLSVYDGLYVALSEQRRSNLVTADARLARSLSNSDLARRIFALSDL